MLKSMLLASIAGVAISAWADKAAAAASDPSPPPQTISDPVQRAQAIQEIQEMKARIGRIEQALGLPAEPPPVQYSPALNKPRDHNLELYGFTQLDAIQDFKRVDPLWEGAMRASKIPTSDGQFGSDGQSIFSVRQTRLGVKATGTLASKPYEAKFEFDLFGTGDDAGKTHIAHSAHVRELGPFPGGPNQYPVHGRRHRPEQHRILGSRRAWPGCVTPRSAGPSRTRTGSARRSRSSTPRSTSIQATSASSTRPLPPNIQPDEKLPDATAAIRYGGKWGHVRLAGLLRRVGYETLDTAEQSTEGS